MKRETEINDSTREREKRIVEFANRQSSKIHAGGASGDVQKTNKLSTHNKPAQDVHYLSPSLSLSLSVGSVFFR